METRDQYSALNSPIIQFLYYFVIFWIPFYRWRHLSEKYPINADWILIFVLALILIPYFLIKKGLPSKLQTNLGPYYLLFFFVNIVAFLLSPYPLPALNGLRILIFGYLFIAISQIIINDKGFFTYFPFVLCLCISISSFLSILGFYLHLDILSEIVSVPGIPEASRGVGGTSGANQSALLSIFILPFLVHWITHARNPSSIFFALILILLNLLNIITTLSRGGFIMLLSMSMLILWEQRHRFQSRYLGLILSTFCIVILLVLVAVPQTFFERQKTLTKGTEADVAMSRRASYLVAGWDFFKKNPFLGTGPDTFRYNWQDSEISKYYKQERRYAHNTYMEVLIGSGIIGLIIFLLLLRRAFLNFTEAIKKFQQAGKEEQVSMIRAYRLAFICVCSYLVILSGIEHKLFLLSLALSAIALKMVQDREELLDES